MIVTAQDQFHVSGEGYNAKGPSAAAECGGPRQGKGLARVLTAAALCCNARLVEQRPLVPGGDAGVIPARPMASAGRPN